MGILLYVVLLLGGTRPYGDGHGTTLHSYPSGSKGSNSKPRTLSPESPTKALLGYPTTSSFSLLHHPPLRPHAPADRITHQRRSDAAHPKPECKPGLRPQYRPGKANSGHCVSELFLPALKNFEPISTSAIPSRRCSSHSPSASVH